MKRAPNTNLSRFRFTASDPFLDWKSYSRPKIACIGVVKALFFDEN